jgi:hypothetical protein
MYPNNDYIHLAWSSVGCAILIPYIIYRLLTSLKKEPSIETKPALIPSLVLIAILFIGALTIPKIPPFNDHQILHHDRARIHYPSKDARNVREVVQYIETNTAPGEPIFHIPGMLFNFLADRPNYTWSDYYGIRYVSPDYERKIVETLNTHPPRFVIGRLGEPNNNTYEYFRKDFPLITEFINQNYVQATKMGYWIILEKVSGLQ